MNTGRILLPGLYILEDDFEGEDNENREDSSLFLPLKGIYTIDLST